MRQFYGRVAAPVRSSAAPQLEQSIHPAHKRSSQQSPLRARIAVYDTPTAPPRVEEVAAGNPREFIDALASAVYELAREAGGSIPFVVIREIAENLIHADFREAVVTITDGGDTIRFADQGPGIPDKERAFLPGFSTASGAMKSVIRGVGSGLPVARECLSFSGGTVTLDDNLGRGTVVTLRARPRLDVHAALPGPVDTHMRLTTRQKQILSLMLELGSIGPSAVSRELGVGLSTAHRDLEALERLSLIASDATGKRSLTPLGESILARLFDGGLAP
ncbi:MAG: ATP-binding protein [Coriobacteriia bacterium]|nr:ATP-binding protein [Coriobacteriia bacterium]